jgi:hypothetical protein
MAYQDPVDVVKQSLQRLLISCKAAVPDKQDITFPKLHILIE